MQFESSTDTGQQSPAGQPEHQAYSTRCYNPLARGYGPTAALAGYGVHTAHARDEVSSRNSNDAPGTLQYRCAVDYFADHPLGNLLGLTGNLGFCRRRRGGGRDGGAKWRSNRYCCQCDITGRGRWLSSRQRNWNAAFNTLQALVQELQPSQD